MSLHPNQQFAIGWARTITDLPRSQWNALTRPLPNPFLDWEWLRAVEKSSATPATGWSPVHLAVRLGDRLVAAAPLYVKDHSEGEFIFDYVWVAVAQNLGLNYYPKLVGMSPFTPANGYRFLIDPDLDPDPITRLMVQAIDSLCLSYGLLGCAFHFVDPSWRHQMLALGYSDWVHQGFAWKNYGYPDFDAYLATFNSNTRKSVRRERRTLKEQDVHTRVFSGQDIPEIFFKWIYELYVLTNDKFGVWSCKFMENDFFQDIAALKRDNLMIVAAYQSEPRDPDSQRPIAMAFFVRKGSNLYGRYWGCFEPRPFLHFEVCYYTAIEWAISNGIQHYDPGMGGEHKAKRGFISLQNFSLHRFYDNRLNTLLKTNIGEINLLEQSQIDQMNQQLPFKKNT